MALMAIVAVGVSPINPRSNVGVLYLGPRRYWFGMELRYTGGPKRSRERECLAVLAHKAITPVDDDKPFTLGVESSGPIHQVQGTAPKVFLKEMDLLPKPLSATDLSASLDNDRGVQIAYQGKPGGYSEAAALKTYPKCEAVPYDQYEVAFKAVELWLVDKAVVPIENTVASSMHHNYDLLLRHRLHIVGEVKLAVNHHLLELPGVKKDELKHVLSHPQDEDSVTRFLVLAREPLLSGTDRPYKTSIVFSLEKGPNALFKVSALFELRDICMSNVESRPLKQLPFRAVDDSNKSTAKCFDYLFYIDFEASIADPRVQYALGHLEEHASFPRVLGCYPTDKSL